MHHLAQPEIALPCVIFPLISITTTFQHVEWRLYLGGESGAIPAPTIQSAASRSCDLGGMVRTAPGTVLAAKRRESRPRRRRIVDRGWVGVLEYVKPALQRRWPVRHSVREAQQPPSPARKPGQFPALTSGWRQNRQKLQPRRARPWLHSQHVSEKRLPARARHGPTSL